MGSNTFFVGARTTLVEEHQLTEAIFAHARELLETKGLLPKRGAIVDATIVAAPTSTKNVSGARDPEMRQTRKGNQWYLDMKARVGTDLHGLVHSLKTTNAAQADINQASELLHGEERALYGDSAYSAAWLQTVCRDVGIAYRVNRPAKALSAHGRKVNRSRSRHRARGEHGFHVVKRLWGVTKVRYRGLAKNAAQLHTMFALANLYTVRKKLRPAHAMRV